MLKPRPFIKSARIMSGSEAEEEEVVEILSHDTSSESESPDDSHLVAVAQTLEVSMETLHAVLESEDGKAIVKKALDAINKKESELEEYESTVKDLTQTTMAYEQRESEH